MADIESPCDEVDVGDKQPEGTVVTLGTWGFTRSADNVQPSVCIEVMLLAYRVNDHACGLTGSECRRMLSTRLMSDGAWLMSDGARFPANFLLSMLSDGNSAHTEIFP
jgi:hypothetical protein